MSGFIASQGYSYSERQMFFYFICIWIRLSIAYFIYYDTKKQYKYLYLLIALFSIYQNFSKMDEKVWWSRKAHLVIGIILVLGLTVFNFSSYQLGKLMTFDVLFGFISSFFWFNR